MHLDIAENLLKHKKNLLGASAPSFNKMCVMPAECRPLCTGRDSTSQIILKITVVMMLLLPEADTGRIYCASPSEITPFRQPRFNVEVDMNSCYGYVYEATDASSILKSDDAINFPDDYSLWSKEEKAIFSDVKNKKYLRSLRSLSFCGRIIRSVVQVVLIKNMIILK